MNEEKLSAQKSIYLSPAAWLFGCCSTNPMDPDQGRLRVACKPCRGQKQKTDQRLAKEKNKKKKCPPPGFMFDR
jgi:hypothetical protein